ncbi:50S ribosomal protein L2 [Frankliniella fusca]|uniref:50S ribosomal protein L2 n=1 Tax=Frankliniella fusca TaxID=407009 RepID=A0AAE1H3B8_9NEOP|nr:50S ribosomal protein L2 [Frankliniella fusca]
MDPPASNSVLAVALLFLLGSGAAARPATAAAATPVGCVATSTQVPIIPHAEPLVVFGSGRSLPESAHRRILDALHAETPLTVRLASGEERTYSSGRDYMAAAASLAGAELRGAELIVPAESFPCEVVADVMEIDFAQRTYLVLPDGATVPYMEQHGGGGGGGAARYPAELAGVGTRPGVAIPHGEQPASAVSYPGCNPYQHQPLYHKQPAVYDWLTPFAQDIPEDQLQVAIGGTQRLSMKVHDAILDSYKAEQPFEVDLASGRHVTVKTYEELIGKAVDPRYLGAQVRLAGGEVRVPIATYRAVVDAHKHKGVYVVDPEDHRVPYSEYAEQRRATKKDKRDKKKEKQHE